ncbi:C-type lectin domain family 14 member A [Electrophorus electricus]|uniref:C-type lectin domain-containing protein n=1 Tax=Electrophorus electricus TaxID=8005 RepID=A0A4W4EBG5_ELEEL|nr:C-type lectin domain family 14 member A [Electrophorus electricus]
MDYQSGLYFLNILTVVFSINDIFYTVRLETVSFENAQKSCKEEDGFLTNMSNQSEISNILTAIRDKGNQTFDTFWIGLKKEKGVCVQSSNPLKGFYWTIDNSTTFMANKWKEDPKSTCTNVLCGKISVEYRDTNIRWGLTASHCKQKHPFICKHDGQNDLKLCTKPLIQGSHDIIKKNNDPHTLQITCNRNTFTLTCSRSSQNWKLVGGTETDISKICLECHSGYRKNMNGNCEDINECEQHQICEHDCINTVGSYECVCRNDLCRTTGIMSSFPSPAPTTNSVAHNQPPITKWTSNSTAGSDIHSEGNTEGLSNILVPVIVALLILVVLIVLLAAIARCFHVRRSKELRKRRAKTSKEAVALNGSDSVEKVNEKEAT